MADDDIKKDANVQRGKPGKPGPSEEAVASDKEQSILNDIKASLIEQNQQIGQDSIHGLPAIRDLLFDMYELQQLQHESNLEALKLEKDRLEGLSAKELNTSEDQREMIAIFEEIRDSLKPPGATTGESGAAGSDGGGLGVLGTSLLLRWIVGAGSVFGSLLTGLGSLFTGVGYAAGGIGAFMLALVGADAIAKKFGDDGKALRNTLINLGEGLEGMGTTGLVALGTLLMTGAIAGLFTKNPTGGGIAIAAIGGGIAAFFGALALVDGGLGWLGIDYSRLKIQFKNFGEAIEALGTKGLVSIGALLGTGAIFGPANAAKAAIGLTALGTGIAGFFAGLGAGDAALAWMNVDGERMSTMVMHMADAIGHIAEKGAGWGLAGLLAAGGLFGQFNSPLTQGKTVLGMTVIGMGIGGFFAGLGVGSAALDWMDTDGSRLKAIMINLADGLSAFTGKQLAGLVGIGGLFAAISAIPGAGTGVAIAAATGFGIAGLAIGGFIAGLAVGGKIADIAGGGDGIKKTLVNLAEGLTAFNTINAENLMVASKAVGLLGVNMMALLTGKTVGALAGMGEAVADTLFFWRDDNAPTQVEKVVAALKKFDEVDGAKLQTTAKGLGEISESMVSWGTLDNETITSNAEAAAKGLELLDEAIQKTAPRLFDMDHIIKFKAHLDTSAIDKQIAELKEISLDISPSQKRQYIDISPNWDITNSSMIHGSAAKALEARGNAFIHDIMQNFTSNRNTSVTNIQPEFNLTYETVKSNGPGGN